MILFIVFSPKLVPESSISNKVACWRVMVSLGDCRVRLLTALKLYPDSKVHGANMGPTWVLSAPDGPHVGPMNLAIRVYIHIYIYIYICVCVCVSPFFQLCGIPALVLSLLAYVDHRTNLHASARSRRRSALILAITGICIGMLFYSLVVASWCYWAYQGLESDGNMPEMDEAMTSQMPPGWEESNEGLMEDMMGSHGGRFGSHESHEGGMGRRPPPPH